ncbi:MAG TPA: proton-conducting transporter membrane subunit, partial [Bacillota bacterium]|nr:proton-conducting transporter membrane subunit [Bacillota bacterium]
MLLGVLASGGPGLASLVYYVLTYGLTTLGAFGVVAVVQAQTGGDQLTDFAGLSRRAPAVALCMLVFMLSLAGIPPLAGFFGKFYLFAAALMTGAPKLGLLWLVVLAIAMSAVSLYYYLQVLKQVFVAPEPASTVQKKVPVFSQLVLGVLALAVVVLGCAPELLLARLGRAIQMAGF